MTRKPGCIERDWAAGLIACLLMSFLFVQASHGADPLKGESRTEPLGLIVTFESGVDVHHAARGVSGATATGVVSFDELGKNYGVSAVASLKRTPEASDGITVGHQLERTVALRFSKDVDWQRVKRAYESLAGVARVELDYPVTFFGSPVDSLYGQQWHLSNSGQLTPRVIRVPGDHNDSVAYIAGIAGTDINADSLYNDVPAQTRPVVIGVLDSGTDVDHPDLQDNIWINVRDSIENGFDDDHNGFVDDKYGWNFATFNTIYEANEPFDELGHGTHVAGIIAATSDNGIGISGICPQARIMSLRVESTSDIASALVYAADNGADIINMSLGIPVTSPSVESAVQYAASRGVVMCAAMGNDGAEVVNYPAAYSHVIAVGAMNDSGTVTPFSTYGDHIDVLAQGQSILSLRGQGTDMYGTDGEPLVHVIDSLYYLASGTSMASPMVAGVAAWIRSISPGLVPSEVQDVIELSARDVVDPFGTGSTLAGWDKFSGHGSVDLYQAVQGTSGTRASLEYPPPFEILSGMIFFYGTADASGSFPGWTLDYGAGFEPTAWTTITQSANSVTDGLLTSWTAPGSLAGLYTFRLRVGPDHEVRRSIYLAPATVAEIVSPVSQDTLRSACQITGDAYSHLFQRSILEYRNAGDPTNTYHLIDTVTVPKTDETITNWQLTDVDTGSYWMRLTVESAGGDAVDSVLVYVDEWESWTQPLNGLASITANYGDFDDDDTTEIVIGTQNTIMFFNLDGSLKASGMPSIPEGDWSVPVVVANFDGDGIDDFAAMNLDSQAVYIFSSLNGTVRKDASAVAPAAPPSWSGDEEMFFNMSAVDYDSDGIDELYISSVPVSGSSRVSLPQEPDTSAIVSARSYLNITPGSGFRHAGIFVADLWGDSDAEAFVVKGPSDLKYIAQVDLSDPQSNDAAYFPSDTLCPGYESFDCIGMSAADIDADGDRELMVTVRYPGGCGYYMFAFDEGLSPVSGFPRYLPDLNSDLRVSAPIFADIDGDCETEYLFAYLELEDSHIMAYNADGSDYGTSPYLVELQDEWLNFLTIADVDDDGSPDLVACTNQNLLNSIAGPFLTALRAWDNTGQPISEVWTTLTTEPNGLYRYTPVIADLDGDNKTEIVVPYQAGSNTGYLFTTRLHAVDFDEDAALVPQWRIDRAQTNVSGQLDQGCPTYYCGDVDGNGTVGDSADVVYLTNYLFYSGPVPPIAEAADVNSSGTLNMTDLTILVAYYNGQQVTLDCPGGGAQKPVAAVSGGGDISVTEKDGRWTVVVHSPVDLRALRLQLSADQPHTAQGHVENLSILGLQDDGEQVIGVLDLTARATMDAGRFDLVSFTSRVRITSAMAVSKDFVEVPLTVSKEGNPVVPTSFALHQNYPNPFNPVTRISFALPEASHVSLTVYNNLGQTVERIAEGSYPAGVHSIEWNAATYSSGVYFYRITAGEYTESRKLLLLK